MYAFTFVIYFSAVKETMEIVATVVIIWRNRPTMKPANEKSGTYKRIIISFSWLHKRALLAGCLQPSSPHPRLLPPNGQKSHWLLMCCGRKWAHVVLRPVSSLSLTLFRSFFLFCSPQHHLKLIVISQLHKNKSGCDTFCIYNKHTHLTYSNIYIRKEKTTKNINYKPTTYTLKRNG